LIGAAGSNSPSCPQTFQPQTDPPAVRFDQYVAERGIVVTPTDEFDGYSVTVGLPPDWALFDRGFLGELAGKRVWGWPADPCAERFGANAVLSVSRVRASLDPTEVFTMLSEWQTHMVEGTRERSRAVGPATDGPGVVGMLFMEIATDEYGVVGSASRTRIVLAGSDTLIAQLTVTALIASPVDFADMGLTVSASNAPGPVPTSYRGPAAAATTEERL
jgi:hypothetical protein